MYDKPLILLTGSLGQIGYELTRVLPLLGNVISVDKDDLDITQPDMIVKFMREHKPNLVINAAGYTSVDKAEHDSETAEKINSIAPGIFAEEAKKNAALMVHFSTDYAFDGKKLAPYHENDSFAPLSEYGRSKLKGDDAIISSGVKHLIFRTGWVYGSRGNNFLITLLDMLKHRNEISIVNDQLGSPTWCRAIALGVGLVLSQKAAYDPEFSGYYNMTCEGKSSWYEFAMLISKYYEARTNRRVTIYPVSTGIYPMGAKRPKYSILDNAKLNNTFKVALPNWQTCLKLVMQDMGYTEPASYSVYPRIFRKHGKK